MAEARAQGTDLLEWGVANLPLVGQAESGDLHLVRPVRDGVLVAAVDGLGHGDEAAAAARLAVTSLDRLAEVPPLELIERCHAALRGTRGVVLSIARFDEPRRVLTWIGVGNVEGVMHHADREGRPPRVSLITRGGIVGSVLPPLQAAEVPVRSGDTLIFATDGIRSGFGDGAPRLEQPPQLLAEQIMDEYGKRTDDALVLVVRYRGSP